MKTIEDNQPRTVRLSMKRSDFDEAWRLRTWEGGNLQVQFDDSSPMSCWLSAKTADEPDRPSIAQPLSHSYRVHPKNSAGEHYIIKLPLLIGTDIQSLKHYLSNEVQHAFEQEYNLVDRFPSGHPKVLPVLYPSEKKDHESKYPFISILEDSIEGSPSIFDVPCVFRESVPGLSLKKWVKTYRTSADGSFAGLEDTNEWCEIAKLLLEALFVMHKERAAHGFVSPGNIIVPDKQAMPDRVTFINAAEIHRDVAFPPGLRIDERIQHLPIRRFYDSLENIYRFGSIDAEGTARFKLDEGSDYYTATDIFSLGVTLAYLASGDETLTSPFDLTELWRENPGWEIIHGAETRRQYRVMKAALMNGLLNAYKKRTCNQNVGYKGWGDSLRRSEIILQCVRSRSDRRALSVNHALTVLNVFRPAPQPVSVPVSSEEPNQTTVDDLLAIALNDDSAPSRKMFTNALLSGVANRAGESGIGFPPAIRDLLDLRVKALFDHLSTLADGPINKKDHSKRSKGVSCMRVLGSRPTLVDSMLTALHHMGPETELIALTSATIWNDDNFGPTSRFASMLQLKRLDGMRIKWIIVIPTTDLLKPTVQKILSFRAHDDTSIDELSRIEDKLPVSTGGTTSPRPVDAYYFACMSPDEYEKLLREKKTFIGILDGISDEDNFETRSLNVHIAPDHSSRGGKLVALTYWIRPIRARRLLRTFNLIKKVAQPCRNFERIL